MNIGVYILNPFFFIELMFLHRRRVQGHPKIEFVFVHATNFSFADNEFDAVPISFGLRNVVDVNRNFENWMFP